MRKKSKLEEENVDLKIKVETIQHNMIVLRETIEKVESVMKNLSGDATNQSLYDSIVNDIGNISDIIKRTGGNGHVSKVETPSPKKKMKQTSMMERKLSGEVETLKDSLSAMKESNTKLLETMEVKERKINELKILLKEAKSKAPATDTAGGDQQTDVVVRMRQMEVDLKRKSDLLSEVKVLLKQAADRERQQESEKEILRRQLKIITEVDPKTPSEALAKELRQAKLTIDRITCEKLEMEHQLNKS